MNRFRIVLALLVLALIAAPSYAQTGNGAPNGPHYNLNIIGVDNPKTSTMTMSNRHTIFVELGSQGDVAKRSLIYLMPAGEFKVCDGNAFDAAYDCDGNQIKAKGAVFALPCNTNIQVPETETATLVPCTTPESQQASYQVWARALGKPGGSAVMTTCAETLLDGQVVGTVCSTENTVDVLLRKNGQNVFQDVTRELTSLLYCDALTLVCTRYSLFDPTFGDFYWQYDNNGLKLAQLRFYAVPAQ